MNAPRSVLFPNLETFADPRRAAQQDLAIARYRLLTAEREQADILEYVRETRNGHSLYPEARRRFLLSCLEVRDARKLVGQALHNLTDINAIRMTA